MDFLPITTTDALGYSAAALVLLTFSLRSIAALRTAAIVSNVLFIAYALAAASTPILLLHATLLPLNIWRLWENRSHQSFARLSPPVPTENCPAHCPHPAPLRDRRHGLSGPHH